MEEKPLTIGTGLPGPGAPKGLRTRARAAEWADAIKWALSHYYDQETALSKVLPSRRALLEMALGVVRRGIDGNHEEWQEVGNRLDGKPRQAVELSGVNEEPLEVLVNVIEGVFVPPAVQGED